MPTNLTNVYEITLKLPMLNYYTVLTDPSNLLISLPVNIDQQFNFITRLVFENHCSFNNILTIISYTPQLYRLDYTNTNSHDRNIEINSPIKLTNLKYVFVRVSNTIFDIFEMFLRKINSKLKVLSFITRYEHINYLDANRWKEIILKYLFRLKKFYLQYYASCEKDSETRIYRCKPNQFISSFWIKRKWIFEIQRDLKNIIYSVRPYKKRWDEYIQHEIVDISSDLSKSTQLTFMYINPNEWRDIIDVYIKRILSVTQIYHLIISVEKIFISVLIAILDSLPKLYSLKIYSLSFADSEGMSHEDYKIFFSTKSKSKIMKVYLEKLDHIRELYFLCAVCPHLIYVKVDWINGKQNTVPFNLFL
ncbi:unnamed protein product [Rotaria sp. Silwood1]|nr:unnamed protein product [Rotaria sp. Silwood1]